MEVSPISTTLERLSNLLRTDLRQRGLRHGLGPVHVETLLYLSRCNRYSDTPQAVTEFLGSTKGTVSQTLKVLERKELLLKRTDPDDRRVVRLELTPHGQAVARDLADSPIYADVLTDGSDESEKLSRDLRRLLRDMQRAGGYRSFGACHSCRFFQQEESGFRCGLTGEPLSMSDSRLICREHESDRAHSAIRSADSEPT